MSRTGPKTNGARQPQSSIADELSDDVRMAATAEPSSEPPAVLTCWKLPKKPRRGAGDHSIMQAGEVPPPRPLRSLARSAAQRGVSEPRCRSSHRMAEDRDLPYRTPSGRSSARGQSSALAYRRGGRSRYLRGGAREIQNQRPRHV